MQREYSSAAWHFGLVILACALVFLNALDNGFHLDDFFRVVGNPGIRPGVPWWMHFVDPSTMSTLPRIEQYRPLLPLSLSINQALTGESVRGYHLGNLAIHAAASVLVYLVAEELLRRATLRVRRDRLALVIALVFAVHPVSGILVNYICARDQLLMQLFLFGSLLTYLRLQRLGSTPLRWALSLGSLVLALLSKTDAAMAPVLVCLLEMSEGGRGPRSWLVALRRALPHTAVVLAFLAFVRFFLEFSDLAQILSSDRTPLEYPLTQAKLHLLRYLPNFFWPFPIQLSPYIELERSLLAPGPVLGLAFILATLAIARSARARCALLSFSILAYWILLAPTSSLLPLHHLAVDYRPYPASPFLWLGLALAADRFLPPRWLAGLGVLALAWFAAASVAINRTWRTEETLWTHSVEHGGDAVAHVNLSKSFADRRDPRVRLHLEEALRLDPDYHVAHINLGLHFLDVGEQEAGLASCRKAVEIAPGSAQAYYWLSVALTRAGRHEEAMKASSMAGQLEPKNLRYRCKAARDALAVGNHAASLEHVEAAARIDPTDPEVRFLGALGKQTQGDLDGAVAGYEELLAAHPDHAWALFNLGHARMVQGQHRQAIACFERALTLEPGLREAHRHLADCYTALGEGGPAAEHERAWAAARDG